MCLTFQTITNVTKRVSIAFLADIVSFSSISGEYQEVVLAECATIIFIIGKIIQLKF